MGGLRPKGHAGLRMPGTEHSGNQDPHLVVKGEEEDITTAE